MCSLTATSIAKTQSLKMQQMNRMLPVRCTVQPQLLLARPLAHRARVAAEHAPPSHPLSYHDDILEVLFSEADIRKRVGEVARTIAADYMDKAPLVLGVLTGAFVFTSDLVRELEPPPRGMNVDFIRASSYGSGTSSSGQVTVTSTTKDTVNVAGRHVILVEDILDTGRTLQKLVGYFQAQGAASVRVAVLLDKKEARLVPIAADYSCFPVDNQFVVGYGLDFDEEYRTLPYIGVLKPEVYGGEDP